MNDEFATLFQKNIGKIGTLFRTIRKMETYIWIDIKKTLADITKRSLGFVREAWR